MNGPIVSFAKSECVKHGVSQQFIVGVEFKNEKNKTNQMPREKATIRSPETIKVESSHKL